jgi:GTPase-activating protein SAC7
VEGIFRLSGAEKRIKELVVIFNSPDRFGKGLDWNGYTVHDAANVLRRYLNQLPEPIVPLDLYERFREPLRGHAQEAVGDQEASQDSEEFDLAETIAKYQQLITELPPLNRQLLLYILDLLAVFASKSDENRMTSQNLAAIFQPGMLSHPAHDMAPSEYRLSQDVLVFLIEHQDHFLIGMRGTAADEQTVQDVQNGNTPPPATPNTPTQNRGKNAVARSSSNASAGAESLRRQGGIRRNVSVNSRNSRQSNGAPSPSSPAFGSSLTRSSSGGLHRSNTVPSKKSPGLPSGRLQKNSDNRTPTTPVFQAVPGLGGSMADYDPAGEPVEHGISSASSPSIQPATMGTSGLAPGSHAATAGHSQDRLLPDPRDRSGTTTPTRERAFFQRSPTTDSDRRQPNKLRKKRIPGSSNHSAQSSTHSLHGQSAGVSPGIPPTPGATDNSEHPQLESAPYVGTATPVKNKATPATDNTHLQRPTLAGEAQHASEVALKPQASSNSLRSRGDSMNEHSDPDHIDDPVKIEEQKEKRRRWRLSRKHDIGGNSANTKNISSSNGGPETSTTSFHSGRPRKSLSGDAVAPVTEPGLMHAYPQVSNESGPSNGSTTKDKEEKKGPIDWLKTKMREAKEEKRERDTEKEKERTAKGGPGDGTRGKSMDVRRSNSDKAETPA